MSFFNNFKRKEKIIYNDLDIPVSISSEQIEETFPELPINVLSELGKTFPIPLSVRHVIESEENKENFSSKVYRATAFQLASKRFLEALSNIIKFENKILFYNNAGISVNLREEIRCIDKIAKDELGQMLYEFHRLRNILKRSSKKERTELHKSFENSISNLQGFCRYVINADHNIEVDNRSAIVDAQIANEQ